MSTLSRLPGSLFLHRSAAHPCSIAMDKTETDSGYLTGQLLVAMPSMRDPRFTRSVIYMCAHNADGAMGLVVNRLVGSITFPDLLEQLGITADDNSGAIRVHFGGPVEAERGFRSEENKSELQSLMRNSYAAF